MHPIRGEHPISRRSGRSGLLMLAGFGFAAAFPNILTAQTPETITNLAQLSQTANRPAVVVVAIRLEATVFACDPNTGALVLQDASGAELLEMDSLPSAFSSGDLIQIEGRQVLISPGDVGIYLCAAPVLNNDGVHHAQTVRRELSVAAGRHKFRLDWFNQVLGAELEFSCVPTADAAGSVPESAFATNTVQVSQAVCYEGFWTRLPNYQLLQPLRIQTVTNLDLGVRTRAEMAGIRFEGHLEVPVSRSYRLSLLSDDGSRLWIGDTGVPVKRLGTGLPPAAPPAIVGEPMDRVDQRRLVTLEGKVGFVYRSGKGLRFEIRSERSSAFVALAEAGSLEPGNLLEARVRISGVAGGVLTEGQRAVLGTLSAASFKELVCVEEPAGKDALPAVLTTVIQVHNLGNDAAARRLPVAIRGTVTAVAEAVDRWIVIQDETRGVFVRLDSIPDCEPKVGELWSLAGHTQPGGFAPVIKAERASLLGPSRLPEPAIPTWSQLANGNLDVQWVELQGRVSGVRSNRLSLLLPEGRLEINMTEWGESELQALGTAVVRIRGVLFTAWNPQTHESRVGEVTLRNAMITVVKPAPNDPFEAPEKTPSSLFRFDANATPLQRVRVRGQVTYVDPARVFVEQDAAIEIQPSLPAALEAGDWVEAVGYLGMPDTGPQLREALLRKTGSGVLPEGPLVSESGLQSGEFASRRIRIEGILANLHREGGKWVLQIQTPNLLFLAQVTGAETLRSLRVGSKLSLTGVCLTPARRDFALSDAPHFELLVHAPRDVIVLSRPSWWTLPRLLSAVGVLVVGLALALVWINLLRRQVAQRTLQLQQEVRGREEIERQHAVEAERARIARDLHDDLGSGLTEMSLLADVESAGRPGSDPAQDRFQRIADKARTLVAELDVIVWAIDPRRNSLQSFVDYVATSVEELLTASNIVCRFKIPVECKPASLTGSARHSLLLAVKEALSNILRHASASEVGLKIAQPDGRLEIVITDDGQGFDQQRIRFGDGLKNLHERMSAMSGTCCIESVLGKGTTVTLNVPLPEDPDPLN